MTDSTHEITECTAHTAIICLLAYGSEGSEGTDEMHGMHGYYFFASLRTNKRMNARHEHMALIIFLLASSRTARHERTHGTACLTKLYLALNKQHDRLQTMAPFTHSKALPQLKAASESK